MFWLVLNCFDQVQIRFFGQFFFIWICPEWFEPNQNELVLNQKQRPCTFFTNCPVNFSFFWSTKFFLVYQMFFWSTKFLFGTPKFLFSIPKNQSLTKKNSETDQKFPETEQIFFGRPKKVRNRPDNWSTKRLTKTTWTGLIFRCISHFLVNQKKKFVQSQGFFVYSFEFFV